MGSDPSSAEVRKDAEAVADVGTENNNLLLPHVIDDPPKVRKPPIINAVTEYTEKELDLLPTVRRLHGVMVVREAHKLADPLGLFPSNNVAIIPIMTKADSKRTRMNLILSKAVAPSMQTLFRNPRSLTNFSNCLEINCSVDKRRTRGVAFVHM